MKKITGVLLGLVAAVLPLIAYFHIEIIAYSQYPWFPNQGYWFDFFLYGKSSLLQMIAIITAVMLVIEKIKSKENYKTIENGLLILTGVFLIISTICSKYLYTSMRGAIEQYEPIGVLLAYLIILYAVSRYAEEDRYVIWLIRALLFGLAVSMVLGILQLFQCDFWESELGKAMLVPNDYEELRETLHFSKGADGFGRVYMALYNPSYAGIYIVMLLPIVVFSEKKYMKIVLLPMLLCLLGTMSKTAWLAAGLILLLGFGIYKKLSKKVIAVIGIVIIAGFAIISAFEHDGVRKGNTKLEEVVGEAEHIRIKYQGNTIYLSEYPKDEGVKYRILDENGEKLQLTWNEERGELDPVDPKYEGLHFKVYLKDGISYAVFRYEDVVFRFTDDLGTGRYEYVSINGKTDELSKASAVSDQFDSILNGRGYIWNRVFPLIGANLLVGTGPDSFMQVFPQNDYVARANLGYGFFSEILTNAHSLYLQSILQNGILPLICMIGFMGISMKKAWKYYTKKQSYDCMDKISLACFLGSCGYLICGLTFASNVGTTPIYMILTGTWIGIIRKRSREDYEKN